MPDKSNIVLALILGGGAGSRLYPLTEQRSKPAVPIAGKYRLIDIPISNCINSGIRRIFVLTQFNSASLNQHIKNTYQFGVFTTGFVDILAAEQTPGNDRWFQGTADAVRQSLHHLHNHVHDYVLILSGDQLYQMDFNEMAKFHFSAGSDLSIATLPVTAKDAVDFGIMKVDEQHRIERFVEKPKAEELPDWTSKVSTADRRSKKNYLASMGIYLFRKEVLQKLLDENPNAVDFGKEIIPAAIEGGYGVSSFTYSGYWTDIGNIPSFFEANLELTDPLPQFNLFDNDRMLYTRARLLPPSKIFGTRLDRSVISEGCIVRAKSLKRCLIGIRSRIGDRVVMNECVMMGADFYESLEQVLDPANTPIGVGANCRLEKVIIDKNARIGRGVVIRGGEGLADREESTHCIRGGVVVVRKGALIPDGTHIGLI